MRLTALDMTEEFHRKGLGDTYGPELVVGVFDRATGGFHGGFVGDNSSLCLRGGGKRVWNGGIREVKDPTWLSRRPLEQLSLLHENLARPMTIKHHWCWPRNETVPFPLAGGGKAMWILGDYQNMREVFMREWTRVMYDFVFRQQDGATRRLLGEAYVGGADSGTDESDMDLICEAAGDQRCVTGGPGTIKYETIGATGLILLHAAKTIVNYLYRFDPVRNSPWNDGLTISLAGFGQVGRGVAQWLQDPEYAGPRLVAVSNKTTEEGEAIRNLDGIDPAKLLASLRESNGILSLVDGIRTGRTVLRNELFETAKILILAATVQPILGSVRDARRVRAGVVLSGTNSGIAEEAYEEFHRRGVIAPLDSTVNIGAASIAWASYHGISDAECIALAKRAVEQNMIWLLGEAQNNTTRIDRLAKDEVYKLLDPLPRYRRSRKSRA